MNPLTSAAHRAFVLAATMTAGVVAAVGAALGALLGGWEAALVAGVIAGCSALVGSFLTRRRSMAKFAAAQESAEASGFADGLAHGLLIGVAQYEAAVFPVNVDGVTAEERASRRTFAYRVASEDALPEAVRRAAATALAALDEGDQEHAHDAMQELAVVVKNQLTEPKS